MGVLSKVRKKKKCEYVKAKAKVLSEEILDDAIEKPDEYIGTKIDIIKQSFFKRKSTKPDQVKSVSEVKPKNKAKEFEDKKSYILRYLDKLRKDEHILIIVKYRGLILGVFYSLLPFSQLRYKYVNKLINEVVFPADSSFVRYLFNVCQKGISVLEKDEIKELG